ncbi:MAG: hypothetical protein CV045_09850 [Cyanobacteria bacterium M5B4]|nr:MAG: hypothetical protein CV045_09850 [Cyanobacteria bacterium M5B4]
MIDNLIRLLQQCTVKITTKITTNTDTVGTGFFISNDTILTCKHVVQNLTATICVTLAQRADGEPPFTVKEIRHPKEPEQLDIALLILEPNPATMPQNNPHVVHLLPEWSHNDPVYAYGFQHTDRKMEGFPITGCIAGDVHCDQMRLVRFRDDRIAGGMSGAAVLNQHTGAVVGVVKSSDDTNFPVGGHFVPVREIFQHMPEVFERNRSYFTDKLEHAWRTHESQLLMQHRLKHTLQAHEHHLLLIGNGYFPYLNTDAPSRAFPEMTLAPEQFTTAIAQFPKERSPTSIVSVVDKPAAHIRQELEQVLAYPAQSTLLVYWGSKIHGQQPYQVLHYATRSCTEENIELSSIKAWVQRLALADKNVFLVLDLRQAQQHLGSNWLPTVHPCLSYVTWKDNVSKDESLVNCVCRAIQAIANSSNAVTARKVGLHITEQNPKVFVHPPKRDFSLLPAT